MYNGTISLSDSSDVTVIKQQVELITALNSQMKEFVSLKSNISGVWEVLKEGAPLFAKLSENTVIHTAVTKAANVVQQALGTSIKQTASKAAILVVAITAVIAVIATLAKLVNRTNEAGEVAKASAEGLVSAHEKLSEAVTESAAAYSRTTVALDATKDMAHTLTARLEELQANTERTEAEQAEMARITGELTDKYSGLNGMIDENTGALAGNAEQWNAVMNTWIRMQKACRNGGFPFRQALV